MARMMSATGAPQGVVEPPAEAVDAQLLIPLHEAVDEDFLMVARPVAICILQEEDLRCSGDNHAVAPHGNPVGKGKPLGEEPARLVAAVAVSVFENANAAASSTLAIHAAWIISHLHHPQPPLGIPVEGHRIENIGLAGDKLHPESRRHVDPPPGLLRRSRQHRCRQRQRRREPRLPRLQA